MAAGVRERLKLRENVRTRCFGPSRFEDVRAITALNASTQALRFGAARARAGMLP